MPSDHPVDPAKSGEKHRSQIAFVVNNPKFSQQVKIVTCKNDSQLGPKTSRCSQQFSVVELETVQLGGDEDLEQQQKPEIS